MLIEIILLGSNACRDVSKLFTFKNSLISLPLHKIEKSPRCYIYIPKTRFIVPLLDVLERTFSSVKTNISIYSALAHKIPPC